jgi:CHAT domain-containing protein
VHLSAHTIERNDSPLFTALRLAGGMLSVEQCSELTLAGTEVVTLSSCKTNTGMNSTGALFAFQSAFFIAGAQRVISSLWEIHGDFAVPWMDQFYQWLAQGLPAQEACRQTHLACLADETLQHPALWAAFVCTRR